MKLATWIGSAALVWATTAFAAPPTSPTALPQRAQATRHDLSVVITLPFALESTQRIDLVATTAGTVDRVFVDVDAMVKRGADLLRIAALGRPPTTIRAPFDGFVANHPVSIGQVVAVGTPTLVTLIDIEHLRAVAGVSQIENPLVKPGQPVELALPAFPDRRYSGVIQVLFPEIDPSTHLRRIEVVVQNPDHLLVAGMTGTLHVLVAQRSGVLTVPRGAVQTRGALRYVVRVAGNHAQERQVAVGGDDGTNVEITGGLDDGDTVLVGNGTGTGTATNLPADGALIP